MKNIFLISSAAAFLMTAVPVVAAEEPQPQIMVTGLGEVSVPPDMAVVNFGVEKLAPTAREALDANNEAMNKVIALLKDAGVDGKDIQTSGFSLNPRYNYNNSSNEAPQVTGYQVNNSVTVRVRNLDSLGDLLDRAVSASLNQGGQITFTNSNTEELMDQARTAAVKNALEKARSMAGAAGVGTGRILSINENGAVFSAQPIAMRATFAKEASPVPIESGESTYRATVNVTLAIDGQ